MACFTKVERKYKKWRATCHVSGSLKTEMKLKIQARFIPNAFGLHIVLPEGD